MQGMGVAFQQVAPSLPIHPNLPLLFKPTCNYLSTIKLYTTYYRSVPLLGTNNNHIPKKLFALLVVTAATSSGERSLILEISSITAVR